MDQQVAKDYDFRTMITFENVTVSTKDNHKLIKNFSFSIRRNSFNLLLGPTGSGKTTILKLIKGIIPYLYDFTVEGEIHINNEVKNSNNYFNQSVNIGYLFQDFDLQFIGSTVEQELIFSLENLGQSRDIIDERMNWVLETYPSFENLLFRNPHTLSGGELAQVIFLETILSDVDILLLDEPFQNLDKGGTDMFMNVLRTFYGSKTILVSTHHLDHFIKFADSFIIINENSGRIDQFISKNDFFTHVEDYPWLNVSKIAIEYYLTEM